MVLLFCLFHLCVPIYIWLLIIISCLGMQIQRVAVTYLWYILFIEPLDIIYWTTRQLLVKSWDSLTLPWYKLVTSARYLYWIYINTYLFLVFSRGAFLKWPAEQPMLSAWILCIWEHHTTIWLMDITCNGSSLIKNILILVLYYMYINMRHAGIYH